MQLTPVPLDVVCQVLGGQRLALQRAFEEPVKQLAARAGGPPVEPEGKLVEIIGEVVRADGALMGSKPPAL
jgi:hypothetical protein